jgi:mannose-1-phosphate guanylyltransferase/mannose-6-phosphate isomerase
MSEGKIVPVILGGGSGTRLWPISRRHRPKQFHAFLGPETLLQATARRAARLLGTHSPVLVSGEGWETAVDQLDSAGVPPALVVIEPQPRNTAPAVAAAAVALDKDDLLLVLPADHVISGQGAFGEAVEAATRLAEQGLLTTFGVVPTRAETGFGYIERGDPLPGGFAVRRFVEKPEAAAAERFLSTGNYLWNSGMFMFRASAFLSELSIRAPSVLEAARRAVSDATSDGRIMRLGKAFEAAPSISIDHAVMEKTESAAVVPLSAGWNDIGSFQALWEASKRDDAGNALSGDVVISEVRGSLVRSEDRLVVVVGLEGVVVIDTPDALLVIARERAQDVKGIVDRLVGEDRPEV